VPSCRRRLHPRRSHRKPGNGRVQEAITAVSDLLDLAEGDRTDIADSVALRLFAGHTPGNCLVEASTSNGPALLLGDTAHHPALLVEDGWADHSDDDPVEAARSRDRLADELERTGALGLGAHFPGVRGGWITRDTLGKRQWQPVDGNHGERTYRQ
jgi:glyoxylase-like metal-dependent hydrolase (beta-lactamase superfamily II)